MVHTPKVIGPWLISLSLAHYLELVPLIALKIGHFININLISINREKPSAAQIPTAQIEAEEVAETAQGLSEEIVAKLDAKNTQLTQSRKKLLSQRKEKLAGVDKLHNYSLRF